jgi:hypothetical protein
LKPPEDATEDPEPHHCGKDDRQSGQDEDEDAVADNHP